MRIYCDAACSTCVASDSRGKDFDDKSLAYYCGKCKKKFFCQIGVVKKSEFGHLTLWCPFCIDQRLVRKQVVEISRITDETGATERFKRTSSYNEYMRIVEMNKWLKLDQTMARLQHRWQKILNIIKKTFQKDRLSKKDLKRLNKYYTELKQVREQWSTLLLKIITEETFEVEEVRTKVMKKVNEYKLLIEDSKKEEQKVEKRILIIDQSLKESQINKLLEKEKKKWSRVQASIDKWETKWQTINEEIKNYLLKDTLSNTDLKLLTAKIKKMNGIRKKWLISINKVNPDDYKTSVNNDVRKALKEYQSKVDSAKKIELEFDKKVNSGIEDIRLESQKEKWLLSVSAIRRAYTTWEDNYNKVYQDLKEEGIDYDTLKEIVQRIKVLDDQKKHLISLITKIKPDDYQKEIRDDINKSLTEFNRIVNDIRTRESQLKENINFMVKEFEIGLEKGIWKKQLEPIQETRNNYLKSKKLLEAFLKVDEPSKEILINSLKQLDQLDGIARHWIDLCNDIKTNEFKTAVREEVEQTKDQYLKEVNVFIADNKKTRQNVENNMKRLDLTSEWLSYNKKLIDARQKWENDFQIITNKLMKDKLSRNELNELLSSIRELEINRKKWLRLVNKINDLKVNVDLRELTEQISNKQEEHTKLREKELENKLLIENKRLKTLLKPIKDRSDELGQRITNLTEEMSSGLAGSIDEQLLQQRIDQLKILLEELSVAVSGISADRFLPELKETVEKERGNFEQTIKEYQTLIHRLESNLQERVAIKKE